MKAKLRKEVLDQLKNMPEDEKKKKDQAILENLIETEEYKNAKKLMIYMSFGTEIDTIPIIERAWEDDKEVYIPHTISETKEMFPARIENFKDMILGDYDIPSIREDKLDIINKEDLDLVVVPGVVFAKDGYRIGYGGGFYDRFLSDIDPDLVSILYQDQLRDQVPYEDHDLPIEKLVTEDGIYKV